MGGHLLLKHRSALAISGVIEHAVGVALLSLVSACAMVSRIHGTTRDPNPIARDGDPARITMATSRPGGQLPVYTIETRDDGWMVLTKTDDQTGPFPMQRLIVRPKDVLSWTRAMRTFLDARPPDTVTTVRESPALGHGRLQLLLSEWRPEPRRVESFQAGDCGRAGPWWGPSDPDLRTFFALLDSVATALIGPRTDERRTDSAPVDTARVYYASEVSCPALPAVSTPRASYPAGIPVAERRAAMVGVRVVVGRNGRVEPGSFAALPDQDPRLARAARSLVERWRFEPAEWDGTRVRQLVQMAIPFDPEVVSGDTSAPPPYVARADSSGWVLIQVRRQGGPPARDWFLPDSVDAWIARVAAFRANVLPRPTQTTSLGSAVGISIEAVEPPSGSAGKSVTNLAFCSGSGGAKGAGPIDSAQLAMFSRAAADARAHVSHPPDLSHVVHEVAEVGCPAGLPWALVAYPTYLFIRQYPIIPYPASMTLSRARAEVLASFVVGADGHANPRTLATIPGADHRAVAALPEALATLRFRPASRGGQPVPQRVVYLFLFEPPSPCANVKASPTCGLR